MNRHQRRQAKKQSTVPQENSPGNLNQLIASAKQHRDAGRYNEAEEIFRRILAIREELPEIHYNLGYVLDMQGKTIDAAAALSRACNLKQEYVEAHYNLGTLLYRQGKFEKAATCYERAINLRPNYAEAHYNLGVALASQNCYEKAATCYEQAIKLKPNYAEAYYNLGIAVSWQNKFDEARWCYEQAIRFKPNYAEAITNLGRIFMIQGIPDKAESRFREALSIQPDCVEAYYNLSTLRTFHSGDTDLAAMETLAVAKNHLPSSSKLILHFALSKALDDIGDYARSIENLCIANSLKRQAIRYDEAESALHFRRIAEIFTADLFDRFQNTGEPSPSPIFILGMPRSGTTLVEQILASHPHVYGAGELLALGTVATRMFDAQGQSIPYPDYITILDAARDSASFRKLGQAYLKKLPQLPPDKYRITDKLPHNFQFVGLIRLILPNAKIIHTTRNPADTCFSCFSTGFETSQEYSYDLGELGRYYQRYSTLMDHWRSVLPPGAMCDLSYEALVDDLETQARRLLDYCGLPWDDRCLGYYKTKRSISTASMVQVRQPLYRKSLQRWRRYEPYLGPLLAELGLSSSPFL